MTAERVQDVMTSSPRTVGLNATAADAARQMKESDCGSVIVTDDEGQISGIVTDRDIVVRAVAEGADPEDCPVSRICSEELEVLSPDDSVGTAIEKMRSKAVRRLPVIEDTNPVGIVSLSDLALAKDPHSALGSISKAAPNH